MTEEQHQCIYGWICLFALRTTSYCSQTHTSSNEIRWTSERCIVCWKKYIIGNGPYRTVLLGNGRHCWMLTFCCFFFIVSRTSVETVDSYYEFESVIAFTMMYSLSATRLITPWPRHLPENFHDWSTCFRKSCKWIIRAARSGCISNAYSLSFNGIRTYALHSHNTYTTPLSPHSSWHYYRWFFL